MATVAVRVVLELDPGAEPIKGSARTEDGEWVFDGWMELAAVIEDARAGRDGGAGRANRRGDVR